MQSKQRLVRASLILFAACIGLLFILGLTGFVAFTVLYDPLKFTHGGITSNARLVIHLPARTTLAQVHPHFVEAAMLGGFSHTIEGPGVCTSEELILNPEECTVVASSTWVEVEIDRKDWMSHRSVSFRFDFKFEGEFDPRKAIGSSITFVLAKNNTESHTKEDWEIFFNYKDNILPKIFPEADISIHETRHPAVFTDDDILRKIQRETDFEIPEKYLPVPTN